MAFPMFGPLNWCFLLGILGHSMSVLTFLRTPALSQDPAVAHVVGLCCLAQKVDNLPCRFQIFFGAWRFRALVALTF